MLFRPEDFEPVTDERWEESRVRAAIARIVADVDEAYGAVPLAGGRERRRDLPRDGRQRLRAAGGVRAHG